MESSDSAHSQKTIPTISARRQLRIREVQKLFDSGWKIAEISARFNISERMVFKDLKMGKIFDRALSESLDQGELLGRQIRGYEHAIRLEWRSYQTINNPFAKSAAMRNIISLKEKYIKFLQSAGLLERVPDQLKVTGEIPFEIPEVRAKFYEFMLWARKMGENNLNP